MSDDKPLRASTHELTILQEKLQRTGAVALSAVAGMGGVGKTELAIQYARQYEADYPGGICWLSAKESNLAANIVQFAQLHMNLVVPQQDFRGNPLSLTEQVEWCWENWQPSEGLALIVLDDVTDVGNCRQLLPKANRFRVLMTTRIRNLDSNIEEISLDVLSPQEALQLLTKLVGEKRVEKEKIVAEQLCKWLGYLPLGLELVGRYVAKKPLHFKADTSRHLIPIHESHNTNDMFLFVSLLAPLLLICIRIKVKSSTQLQMAISTARV